MMKRKAVGGGSKQSLETNTRKCGRGSQQYGDKKGQKDNGGAALELLLRAGVRAVEFKIENTASGGRCST